MVLVKICIKHHGCSFIHFIKNQPQVVNFFCCCTGKFKSKKSLNNHQHRCDIFGQKINEYYNYIVRLLPEYAPYKICNKSVEFKMFDFKDWFHSLNGNFKYSVSNSVYKVENDTTYKTIKCFHKKACNCNFEISISFTNGIAKLTAKNYHCHESNSDETLLNNPLSENTKIFD